MRLSLLIWPGVVLVATISVIHFLRYRLGMEIHWTWEPALTSAVLLLAVIPPLAGLMRIRTLRTVSGDRSR